MSLTLVVKSYFFCTRPRSGSLARCKPRCIIISVRNQIRLFLSIHCKNERIMHAVYECDTFNQWLHKTLQKRLHGMHTGSSLPKDNVKGHKYFRTLWKTRLFVAARCNRPFRGVVTAVPVPYVSIGWASNRMRPDQSAFDTRTNRRQRTNHSRVHGDDASREAHITRISTEACI